jgi:hypothetical protein
MEKKEKIGNSIDQLIREDRDVAYYYGKIASARFFAKTILTLSPGKAQAIKRMEKVALEIPEECFG